MNDILKQLPQIPPVDEQVVYLILAILTGLLLLVFSLRPPLRRWWQERQISRAVNRLGGLAIRVGPPPPDVAQTEAQWECDSVTELVAWLEGFATAERQGSADDV